MFQSQIKCLELGCHYRQINIRILHLVCSLLIVGCRPDAPADSVATPPSKSAIVASSSKGPTKFNSETEPASSPGATFQFRDATQDWDLQFTRYDDMRGENRIMEANGGGIAVLDYDLDGRFDLFFTQGGKLPLRNFEQLLSNALFRNRHTSMLGQTGEGHFEDVTTSAELTATGFHTGVAVGDLDADGFPDLFVTAYGHSSLWMNAGDGSFQKVRAVNEVSETWGASVALADFNDDGWLDIFIATYVAAPDDPPVICRDPRSRTGTIQCPPTTMAGLNDILLVNDGAGGFIDVSKLAGITTPDSKGLGVVAVDINGDGRLDIVVANDGTPLSLYLNETPTKEPSLVPGTDIVLPRFQDRGTEFGVATNGEGQTTAAMGIASGDYDRDGWVDLFVTNFYMEANTLFHNQAGQGFMDFSSSSRLGPPSRRTLAFGTEFLDIDHDQWLDLVVTTGHIEDRTYTQTEPYRMRPHLFRNERNGRFTDVAEGAGTYFESEWVGRSLASGDFDRDGDIDLIMAQQIDPAALLLNETPAPGTSIIIKPVGRNRSPRNGIGTRVTASGISPEFTRVIAGGGGFQAASAQEFHLPLGSETVFKELVLTWPDGHVDRLPNIKAGYYVAVEGQGLYRIPVRTH